MSNEAAWINAFNNVSQAAMSTAGNARNRKNAEAQRQYELEMWVRNNEYNTPLNQRKRLEAGGLNPNLVYGHGTVANTSSAPPRSVDYPKTIVPELDMMGYFDAAVKNQQTMNQAKAMEVMDSQIANNRANNAKIAAETAGVLAANKLKDVNYRLAEDTYHNSVEKSLLDNKSASLKNERAEIENSNLDSHMKSKIYETLTRIEQAKSTMNLQEFDMALKKEELELRKNGMSYADPMIYRQVVRALTGNESMLKAFDDFIAPFRSKVRKAIGTE